MLKPSLPLNECERLDALRALNILDTEGEERFDRITRLAKRLFGVPIALITLVDQDRQWFKSRQGLDARETSREISFCGHAILKESALVVADTLNDERFHDNPLVTTEPRIRFYAGQPLRAPGGIQIGTLCLIDSEPRHMSLEDLSLLQDLSQMVEHELVSATLAITDDLTGLSNRRGFQAIAGYALARTHREGGEATLLYFDLDDFKPINDSFGHAEGDRALRDFATLLLEAFRDSDIIARLGGDEFGVLLSGTARMDAQRAMDRFTAQLARHNANAGRAYSLAFSAGAVSYEFRDPPSPQRLLEQADKLMYKAKKRSQHRSARVA